jgi:hypothetical protein
MTRTWTYSICWVRVLLIGYSWLSVYIISWTRTFEVVVHTSRNYQSARAVWIFHQVVPSLVLRTVGAMHRVHRAFEAFDDPVRDLARFVEIRIFSGCDQFLPRWSWSCGIEPWLAWPNIKKSWSARVARVLSPSRYLSFSQIKPG